MNGRSRISRLGGLLAIGILVGNLVSVPLWADEPDDSGWDYRLTLYLLAAAQSGTTTVRGVEADLDMSFGDIASNLDAGAMVHFRAQSERWLAQVDTIFMRLETDITNTSATVEFEQLALEFTGGYRVTPEIEVLFGARYNDLSGGLRGGPMGNLDIGGGVDWWDPLVGAAWQRSLSESWTVRLRGDVGGFSVGSDLTWQLAALAGWDFARQWSLVMGYRYIDMDYQEGSGSTLFRYDVVTSGPEVGVSFRF